MAIQFPANVAPGTTYTVGNYTWSWTGNRWAIAAVTSTVSVASNLSLVGTAILPTANVTFDIGTANLRWRDLYLAGNTIDLGGTAIKSSANGVSFTSAANAAVSLPLVVSSVSLSSGGNVVTLVAGASGLQTVSSTGNVVPLQGGGGFLYSNTAPTAPITGDRWLDSETLKEFVFTTVGATGLWIEPAGDGSQVGATGATGVTGVTGSTGATGPVAGADTQVIYNSAGTAAGSANLTFNGTTLTMAANPVLSAGTANGVLYLSGSKAATTGSALTFDGTNLGIGATSPSYKLDVQTTATGTSAGDNTAIYLASQASGRDVNIRMGDGVNASARLGYLSGSMYFLTNAAERMRLDLSGNLGLGVAPSAWRSVWRALQFGNSGALFARTDTSYSVNIGGNIFNNASNQDIYINSSFATIYQQSSGEHRWLTAPSGTAGNAITFTQAMTLDASGRLLLNTTSGTGSTGTVLYGYGGTGVPYNNNSGALWSADGNISLTSNWGTFNIPATSTKDNTAPWWLVGNVAGVGNGFVINLRSGWNGSTGGGDARAYRITNGGTAIAATVTGHEWMVGSTATPSMTLDASGRLGIGTTSPAYTLDVNGRIRGSDIGLTSNSNWYYFDSFGGSNFMGLGGGYSLQFWINATERFRITNNGYFMASNNGSYTDTAASYHEIRNSNNALGIMIRSTNAFLSSDVLAVTADRNTTNNSYYPLNYYNWGAGLYRFRVADSGNVTNTNGSYGVISDVKMKTDIVDAGSQWTDIKGIRFRKFKMKDDPTGLLQLGVVAQELELTSPGLVEEHTDRDPEGNDLGTTTKSVKTSILLMKAAKALQEAMDRIETLEAKVAALEGT